MTDDRADTPLSLAADTKFLLGEINAVVRTLPARMDRFEQNVNQNLAGLNMRIYALEQAQARRSGGISAITAVATVVASFIASVSSGLVAFILSRGH